MMGLFGHRHFGLRLLLRRKARQETDEAKKAAIHALLASSNEEFSEFVGMAEGMHASSAAGPLTDFLDWVIANWDSILKIIMTLFG